jgi:hypothetical protein
MGFFQMEPKRANGKLMCVCLVLRSSVAKTTPCLLYVLPNSHLHIETYKMCEVKTALNKTLFVLKNLFGVYNRI